MDKQENLIISTDKWNTYYLNDLKTSWIMIKKLKENEGLTIEQFEELWKNKPINKLLIKIKDKVIECPRFSKSYLKAYKFSGMDHEADLNPPELINKILNYSQTINPNLNQCLGNWYESDGYIGKHSDDVKQLVADSEIFSYSFGPAKRVFTLEPKYNDGYKLKVLLEHNILVIMGGKCQLTHLHSVEKVKNDDIINGRRINLTFRCFK